MSKRKNRKEKIFDLYTSNLEFVKTHPQIVLTPDEKDKYICPICFNGFTKEDLDSKSPNQLTFEDIPPKSLGGKPLILTCKSCNSIAGYKLDVHLLNILESEAFKGFSPNSEASVTYEKDNKKMNGRVEIDNEGKWHMHLEPKQSNPKDSEYILNKLKANSSSIVDFESLSGNIPNSVKMAFTIKEKGKLRNAEVNMLRIAYLLAFEKFGYGFLMNTNLDKIREQIQNPEKEILNHTFWLRSDFPDSYLGTHIIKEPKEMISFIVIFKLQTASFNRNFGIVLPGPTSPGLEIYDYIRDVICVGDGSENCKMEFQPFTSLNFVTSTKFIHAFASHKLWQDIVLKKNAD